MKHLTIWIQREADGHWRSEVQQIPALCARARRHEDAIAQVQILTLRWMAQQIEEGNVKPLEFSVAVRNATRSIGIAFQEAIARFREAAALAIDSKTERAGARVAVAAAGELLRELGINTFSLSPLTNLLQALDDLEHGTVAPLLRPAVKTQNRPLDPTSAWSVRAFLAAALETRVLMGETVKPAAKRVAEDAESLKVVIIGAKRGGVPAPARIVQLRKDFRRPGGAGPREGHHHDAWRSIANAAHAAASSQEPERLSELEMVYRSALSMAARLR